MWLVLGAGVASFVPSLAAAQTAVLITEHVRAELLAHAPAGVAPGKPVWLALALQHQPHWHSYWRNPGDSGLPTTLSWQLASGAVAGDIAWPTPLALKVGPLINYGYEGSVLLPVPVTVRGRLQGRRTAREVAGASGWSAGTSACRRRASSL